MAIFRDAHETRFEFGVGELQNNELRVLRLRGVEGISQLFRFDLELIAEDPNLEFKNVLGKDAALLLGAEDVDRRVNGMICRFEEGTIGRRFTRYAAELVPRVWPLLHRVDTRIFQDKSVPTIVDDVLKEAGLPADSWRWAAAPGEYAKREYCVQYQENDWAFIARLLEDEGIFFFFEHTDDDHILVFGDKPAHFAPIPGQGTVTFRSSAGMTEEEDHVEGFRVAESIRPGEVLVRNFAFKTPKANIDGKSKGELFSDLRVYEYQHGAYATQEAGRQRAKVRFEEQQALRKIGTGTSTVERFTAGHKFTMSEHARSEFNREWVITDVRHEGFEPQALEQDAPQPGDEKEYVNEFRAIPSDVPYRPLRMTPTPHIRGTQTATVVGPPGEEIHVDAYGRVKVRFHWDLRGEADDRASGWIRVSQPAGAGAAAVMIPRVGWEVVVAFHEGDPSQPHILGRVWNPDTMPPHELPANKTITTFKTLSSPGASGFNELRFEDKAGEEQIYVHAEKNMDLRVKNDRYETIAHDSHLTVENDLYEWVKNERHTKVVGDDLTLLGKDRHLKVDGKQAVEVTGSSSFKVTGDVIEVFGANHSEETTGNLYVKGMGIVIESASGITIKCGGSSIVVDSLGITASGPQVVLDGQTTTRINSGPGSPALSGTAGSLVSPLEAQEAEPADEADPGKANEAKAEQRQAGTGKYGKRSLPAHNPTEQERNDPERTFIEIVLRDREGNPVPGEPYEVTLPDGTKVAKGTLDDQGFARVDGIEPGSCKVTFPRLDKDAWERG